MTLTRAVLYHLFAGKNQGRSIRLRTVLFTIGLCLLAILVYQLTPKTMFGYGTAGVISLLFVLTFLFTTSLYVFTAGAQRVFLRRLEILRHLPLRRVQIRGLLSLAYAPVTLLGCVVILPAACSLFRGTLGVATTIFITLACYALVAVSNILMRTTEFRFSKYMQPAGLVSLFLSLLLAWKMIVPLGPSPVLQQYILGMVLLHIGLIAFFVRRQPKTNFILLPRPVQEHLRLSIGTGLILRALRVGRYRSANFTLAATFFGLACAARASPALPFDAVMAVTFLLAGTFGQEARSISNCRYTIEQVRYGLFNRWLAATWVLAFLNAALCITVVYVTAALVSLDTNISFMQAACVCISLVSIAIMTGSVVVPQKSDMLAQLGGSALYSLLAWCVFRAIGHARSEEQLLITTGLVIACLSGSYVWEKGRWLTTVRNKHATVFQK